MTLAIILLATICLAYANGANDNFKGVATLFGSGTTNYRRALAWATITTLLGSLTAVFLAGTLLKSFSGKGLVESDLVASVDYGAAVALGAGLTVLLATRIGMPISTTHSLVGALIGAGWAAGSVINLDKLASGFFAPLLISPFLAVGAALLLYPILGMGLFQVAQFVRENPTRVLVIGAEQLPETPPLFDGNRFVASLFDDDPSRVELLSLSLDEATGTATLEQQRARARAVVEEGEYEAVLIFPPNFGEELTTFREQLAAAGSSPAVANRVVVPSAEIIHSSAKEKSQITLGRIGRVLTAWSVSLRHQNAESLGIDPVIFERVGAEAVDVAEASHRDAAGWSKVFPFMLLIWALTGAFYPAVDICAGEKERGTLETLLCSPAERTEIVLGKLFTVAAFSMATVVFNLMSIGVTGTLVMRHLPGVGPPPLTVIPIVLVALVPVSMLFSAICLALAAFARSTKEGQYYLMPVLLTTIPLVMLPMAPNVELNLGNSLIPITGVMLLMRAMIEGDYIEALPYVLPVAAVTIGGCLLALQWAVDQFNSESVLFREGERFEIRLWMRQLLRDREDTPTAFAALFCGLTILLMKFALGFVYTAPRGFNDTAVMATVTQLATILTPALLMTVMLTRSARKTLLLRLPSPGMLVAAVVLAVSLHPSVSAFQELVMWMYPLPDSVVKLLAEMMQGSPSIWYTLAVLAVLPAVCEELAYRGFILSGLRHLGHRWRAIIISSVLFGLAHSVFQQSIIACTVGVLIGYVAVKTRSILPGMAYHMMHNALPLVAALYLPGLLTPYLTGAAANNGVVASLLHPFFEVTVQAAADSRLAPVTEVSYRWPLVVLSLVLTAAILIWLRRRQHEATVEEAVQEAIEHESAHPAAS
jgi:sodium transport system permease protein